MIEKTHIYTEEEWRDEIASEILFWDNWLKTEGDRWNEEFKRRNDPNTKLQDIFLKYIDKTQAKNKILDVGAGPLTGINKKCYFAEIEICPTDPPADEYDKLLEKYNIKPVVRTLKCDGEKLTEKFKENTFDITNSSNAIDHSYDPVKCIEEMIKVTKNKHFIILQHSENEGERQNWYGLHKWNFFIEKNALWLQGRDLKKVNLTRKFKNISEMVQFTKEGEMITAVFFKI